MSALDELRDGRGSDQLREHDYLQEIDDLLLPLSWRRRRRVLAELEHRLRTDVGAACPLESSALTYAAGVLRREKPSSRVPLTLRPFASLWPSPREWIAAGVRGIGLVLAVIVAVGMCQGLGNQLMWGVASFSRVWQTLRDPVDQGIAHDLLAPSGYLIATLVGGWLIGQFRNGRRLAREARARRHQRAISIVAALWIVAAAVWAAPALL